MKTQTKHLNSLNNENKNIFKLNIEENKIPKKKQQSYLSKANKIILKNDEYNNNLNINHTIEKKNSHKRYSRYLSFKASKSPKSNNKHNDDYYSNFLKNLKEDINKVEVAIKKANSPNKKK